MLQYVFSLVPSLLSLCRSVYIAVTGYKSYLEHVFNAHVAVAPPLSMSPVHMLLECPWSLMIGHMWFLSPVTDTSHGAPVL